MNCFAVVTPSTWMAATPRPINRVSWMHSRATILRELRRGRLRGVKVAGRKCWRSRPEWVDDWLISQSEVNKVLGRRHGDRFTQELLKPAFRGWRPSFVGRRQRVRFHQNPKGIRTLKLAPRAGLEPATLRLTDSSARFRTDADSLRLSNKYGHELDARASHRVTPNRAVFEGEGAQNWAQFFDEPRGRLGCPIRTLMRCGIHCRRR
jgi:hypothetical protein